MVRSQVPWASLTPQGVELFTYEQVKDHASVTSGPPSQQIAEQVVICIPTFITQTQQLQHKLSFIWHSLHSIFATQTNNRPIMVKIESCDRLQDSVQMCEWFGGTMINEEKAQFLLSRSHWFQHFSTMALPHDFHGKDVNADEQAMTVRFYGQEPTLHPMRPLQSTYTQPPKPFYSRWQQHLSQYFCLSIWGTSHDDVNRIHEWLNLPRVDEYWKDSGTFEFHQEWIQKLHQDGHSLPVLGSFRDKAGQNDEPFAFFDIYWAYEDKIGSLYESQPFDRGIHMLVGSSRHRGMHRVKAWLPSLVHYMFCCDSRTSRVVSEPDRRNTKMISYLEMVGFVKVDEVDKGNKIAAMMILDRKQFYDLCPL